MKYIITFLSAFLFFQFSAQAQTFKCGTDQSDAFMEDLIRNKKDWDNTMRKAQVERFVPVQFHLIANNDGSGRVDPRTVLKSLCELNENYDSLELRFYLADEMNEINNTQINNNPGGNASASAMRNAKNNAAMNVFVIDDSGEGVAGFYTQGGDYIVVNQNQLLLDRHTTEHEVGHFFTLAHTHRGWEDQPYDPAIHGDTVLVTTVNSSQSPTIGVELVDGSNCGNLGWNNPLAGDGICDTPPDYGFGQRCNCCNMGWTVYDRNGDLIEPMLDNVMSYSENCSPWNFTPQQVLAVKTSYDSDRRAYLRVNEVSDYTPLTEGSVIVSPMNLETIDSYNGVLLEWEPVPNAEEYIITVDGTVANEYRTSNTELYLTDLKPNGNYLWSVIPINKFGAGCQPNDSKLFFTGNSTTSVNDLTAINELRIYPNPVERGSDLQISFNSDNAFEAKIRLIALDGKAINEANNIRVNNGSNTISFPVNNASSGLHFIEISNSEGIKIQKIIIE